MDMRASDVDQGLTWFANFYNSKFEVTPGPESAGPELQKDSHSFRSASQYYLQQQQRY
jgi:hypothetical protein